LFGEKFDIEFADGFHSHVGVDFIGELPVEFGTEVFGDSEVQGQGTLSILGGVLDGDFDILDKVFDFLIGLEVFLPAAVEQVGSSLSLGAGGDAFVGDLIVCFG
jgi:hypothetical protein